MRVTVFTSEAAEGQFVEVRLEDQEHLMILMD